MKLNDLRKKTLIDSSSQDELAKKRSVGVEKSKRSRKPSIYDELDEEDEIDLYSSPIDEDLIDDDDEDDDENFDDEDEK